MRKVFIKPDKGYGKMGRELVLRWLIPETVDEKLEREIVNLTKEEVVLRLFKEKKISSGYGAELLGITKRDFWELLHKRRIPLFDYPKEELEKELEALAELKKEMN